MEPVLQSERITLFPLSVEQLAFCLNDPPRLEAALGCAISRPVLTDVVRRAIGIKLDKMAGVPPARHAWYTYWLLRVRADGFGVGLIGFKGSPDAAGAAEIGYGIDPAYRGQGYTTEATRLLIAWAFSEPACQAVVARGVKNENVASRRVLEKAGMVIYAEDAGASSWRILRAQFAAPHEL